MTEFQLEGIGPACEAQELMTEADAKHRNLPQNAPNALLRIDKRLRVAGTIAQEHTVGLV